MIKRGKGQRTPEGPARALLKGAAEKPEALVEDNFVGSRDREDEGSYVFYPCYRGYFIFNSIIKPLITCNQRGFYNL